MALVLTGEYLDWCLRQEKFAEHLYLELSRHKNTPEQAREIFAELARQEQEHYNSISFVKRVLRSSSELEKKFNLNQEERENIEAYDRMVAQIELENLTFSQALELANELEAQFYEIHCLLERTSTNKTLASMFAKLSSGDHLHFETLRKLMDSRTEHNE